MAKVRNEEKLQKQILDQNSICGKEFSDFIKQGKIQVSEYFNSL